MPLVIRPVTEGDLETAATIQNAAFATTSPIYGIIFPNGATEVALADMLKMHVAEFNHPKATCLKVVDTENDDRMVSWISWKTYEHDQPESEWNKPSLPNEEEQEPSHPDINRDFRNRILFAGLDREKRKFIKGKARVYVGLVITHPDYHRRGAGKIMLDTVFKHADNLGLPTLLSASAVGYPLYAREGFVTVPGAVHVMDLRPWGLDMDYKNYLMERPVPKQTTAS